MSEAFIAFTAHPIGRVKSPYRQQSGTPVQANFGECQDAEVHVYEEFRPALQDLSQFTHVWIIAWLDRSKPYELLTVPYRDVVRRGLFATRSPSRPNPIGISCAKLVRVDPDSGILYIKGIDLLDGTPVVDIKPYIPQVDSFPEATSGWFTRGTDRQIADDRFQSDDKTKP